MTTNERKELILKYLGKEEYKGFTAWAIAKKIFEDNSKKFGRNDFEGLRQAVTRAMNNPDTAGGKPETVKVQVEKDKPKYQVISGNYYWESKNGVINLSVDFIDQLFYEYSEHGLNLSQTEMINKHNLQIWEWNSIKSTLWLYKKANIFSPHTVENTPQDQLGEMVADKINKMISNTGYQVEQKYRSEITKKYKEVIKRQTEEDIILTALVTELYDLLPECEVKPAIRVNTDGNGVANIFIFDIHFGSEARSKDLPPYSPQIVKEILIYMAEEINKLQAREVNIFFGGDNIETSTGLSHLDSWKGIARGYYGSKVIIELYKLLVEFISSINNVKAVFAVPGNHDRATEKKDVDGEGYMAELLFELVKLAFGKHISVKYDQKVISESIDGIQYIMSHGHLKLSDMNPAELILEYGDPYKFNLLLSGHWHERRTKKDNKNYRQIVCPPIFPGNDYSKNLGYSTAPGFLIVMNNDYNNKPKVIDMPL